MSSKRDREHEYQIILRPTKPIEKVSMNAGSPNLALRLIKNQYPCYEAIAIIDQNGVERKIVGQCKCHSWVYEDEKHRVKGDVVTCEDCLT